MDYEYIGRLKTNLENFYQLKFNTLLNSKDFGEIRELMGFIKAIKIFGDLIEDSKHEGDKK